ncbi:MAG: NAD(P)H-hydrate dehydratase [Actinomycetota bacterium]
MKPILTPDEVGALDRATQEAGTPAGALMERAGRAVARAVVDLAGGVYGRRCVVVCGKGNNGGDGLVAARHLSRWGMRVTVFAVEPTDALGEPAAGNLRALDDVGVSVRDWSPASLSHELARADVAVDAIFGTGFRGFPEDEWAQAIAALNEGPAPIVAVDIPSGVNGTTGAVEGAGVRAELTVTFGAAKVGVMMLPGANLAGAVRVVDIGFPEGIVNAGAFLVTPFDVSAWLPVRPVDTHKRATGVLVIVAGSRGMVGAPGLVAEAAGRIGAGLVTVAAPAEIVPTLQSRFSEAIFLPLPSTERGTIGRDGLSAVLGLLDRAHALAIGPGLTTDEETAGLVRDLVRASPVPLVIDADGLNAFTGHASDLADRVADAVLTPHAGEAARLAGIGAPELATDRLELVRAIAKETDAVTLLKGSRTIVAEPSGAARINPTGGPVLATAGSGDVLTGVIGGLLSRGLSPVDAASAAAYVHGLAGSLAGRRTGEGTLAGDIAAAIPEAVAHLERS